MRVKCADVNERDSPLPVHEKILRGDKEKAKYLYLTLSLFISFFSDIFSPKRLTAARAMLHWTRTKGKNRGVNVTSLFDNYIYPKEPIYQAEKSA